MTQRKAVFLLVIVVLAMAMLACGDFNDSSPTLNAVQHQAQEANRR